MKKLFSVLYVTSSSIMGMSQPNIHNDIYLKIINQSNSPIKFKYINDLDSHQQPILSSLSINQLHEKGITIESAQHYPPADSTFLLTVTSPDSERATLAIKDRYFHLIKAVNDVDPHQKAVILEELCKESYQSYSNQSLTKLISRQTLTLDTDTAILAVANPDGSCHLQPWDTFKQSFR